MRGNKLAVLLLLVCATVAARARADDRLGVLFLGDDGHHRPAQMHAGIVNEMKQFGIDATYTADVAKLNAGNLAQFDCVLIYRDSGDLPPESETALLDFVNGGHGLVAVHCASHAFRNSAKYTALVGGRFAHHETGAFRARIIDAQHPAMRGVKSFESWDETYVHNELTDDRRVLMAREADGGYEPYTWVRQQGKGRVYYTALGHDERTWRVPEFRTLLAAALRWAAGRTNDELPPTEFTDAGEGLPNYISGQKWGTEGDRLRRMPRALSPQDSLRQFHTPEGFRVELFAAEPDVVKPLAMSFDERGRLWVAESLDYPNALRDDPQENGRDRIKICEDTDGDGRADRFAVFADRLNIPTSVLPVRNGAIVALAPHLVYLEDTDNDGQCDRRTILFTGFGRRDTHAVTSNLHYGLDNWIYASIGYSGGAIRTADGEHTFKQGLYRFSPDGQRFEALTSTSNNTWGLGISEQGEVFASTANNEHSVFLALPNRFFESVRGWHGAGSAGIEDHKHFHPIADDVRQMDWHGAFTAASGHELYTARSFPREYWNRAALVCEPTGHLVHLDWLVPRGAGYTARDGYNLLASTDPWCAPVAAQVGPDGAVWVLDWYNYVIQHNPTPQGFQTGPGNAYETPLRDQAHGRVYRVIYGAGKSQPAPRLDRQAPESLLAALGHDNFFWRLQTQRLLVERGQRDVIPMLIEIVSKDQNPAKVIHALAALAGLSSSSAPPNQNDAEHQNPSPLAGEGKVRGQQQKTNPSTSESLASACAALLAAKPRRAVEVRRVALGFLPRTTTSAELVLSSGCLTDDNLPLRLSALEALAEMPGSPATADALIGQLADPATAADRWLPLAATSAAARANESFLTAAAHYHPADNAEVPAPLVSAVRVVAEHFARDEPGTTVFPVLKALAAGDRAIAAAGVAGLLAGWPAEAPPPIDDQLKAALADLLRILPGSNGLPVVTLANRWGVGDTLRAAAQEMRASLLVEAAEVVRPDAERLRAISGLLSSQPCADDIRQIVTLITPRSAPEFAAGVLDALGQSSAAEVGDAIVSHFAQFTPAAQDKAAAVLLRRPEWTRSLLAALENDTIPLARLSVETEGRLSQHQDAKIREQAQKLLAQAGRLTSADRQEVFDRLLPLADKHGDAAAGRLVFEKNCAKCHRHVGLGTNPLAGAATTKVPVGGNVGPDLSGMAARKRVDILTDVLDPNRSVEGNFQQYTVVTSDGRVLTGLLAAETRTTIELLDAEARREVILREDIEELAGSKRSIMPEGFEKLPPDELVNLLEFLAARGRYLPLPLDKAATATSTVGMFYDRAAEAERLIFADWNPRTLCGVPFHLIDPRGDRVRNVIMLYSPNGTFPPQMPRSVSVPCNAPAKAIHLLSGVSGWGFPLGEKGSLTMTVRLVYVDGEVEDHPLRNGQHFADYIRRVDVPNSEFAARLRDQQIRHVMIEPKRRAEIERVEFIKGDDATAPVVMAATVEAPE